MTQRRTVRRNTPSARHAHFNQVQLFGMYFIARLLVQPQVTVPLDRVELVQAALGGEAGLIGAAIWASQQKSTTE